MALHFERSEYQARIAATIEALGEKGLDGLLMFHQGHCSDKRLKHISNILVLLFGSADE